ncbi:MAG: hypothetical protein IK131_00405 [Paludibacteraceae bacterium]|nr:hypothetical protein [Paludibacteraceae bacterium]
MRNFIFVVMVLLSANLYAQILNFSDIPNENISQLDKMGVDDSPFLNEYESAYLGIIYKDSTKIVRKGSLNGFNFSGKKIGFIYGGARSNKKEYFDMEKGRFKHGETPNSGTLYIFDEAQKEESGGYDAVIVYWSKFLYTREQVAKKMGKISSREKH